jgi:hypothetical protein
MGLLLPSLILLLGVGAYAVFGWSADPLGALAMLPVIHRQAWETVAEARAPLQHEDWRSTDQRLTTALPLIPEPYATAVKIRSRDPDSVWGQSRRALILVSSVLAPANNRAISLAVLGKRVGATTVECCGQRIMITCGMPGGLSSSTTIRSLPLILPSASTLLGDDVVTAGSIPSRARFGASTS